MKKSILLFCLFLITGVLIAPHYGDARAGGGRSVGSRGTHTYSSPSNAQPINRSTTAPSSSPQPYNNQPASQPYNTNRSPFWSGLAGGFLGAGLFHMFLGGNNYSAGGIGGSGIGFFELLLIGGVLYYLYKKFSSGGVMSNTSGLSPFNYSAPANANIPLPNMAYSAQAPISSAQLLITDSDKNDFERLLQNIQQAWSNGDLIKLRQYVTPEMHHYFSEELSANASRGLANKIEQVVLQKADIVESWNEYNLDYATASMQWSALDYMYRLDKEPGTQGYIESGDNQLPVTAEEYWTFIRSPGGHWLLSAIQQASG